MKITGFALFVIGLLIAMIVGSIFIAIAKPSAAKAAYDAQSPYTVTLTNGSTVTVSPDSTVSPSDVTKFWDLAQIFYPLILGVVLIIGVIAHMKFKHDG